MKTTELKNFAKTLPETFGIYLMYNDFNELLYVGKSKNLKKRVSSYFREKNLSPRIQKMVSQIDHIEFITVRSESEALILENNYIKNYNPKYNILFRDDKSYPYLIFSDHDFPRILYYRGKSQLNQQHSFGPFPHANAVYDTIQLLQRIFKLRTCKDSVFQNRSRPCLLHNINRCSAPCVDKISQEDYANVIKMANLLLKGKKSNLIIHLTNLMNQASEEFNFEKAIFYRNQIQSLNQIQQKQYVTTAIPIDCDVIGIATYANEFCMNVVHFRSGNQVGEERFFYTNQHQLSEIQIYQQFKSFYYDSHEMPKNLISSYESTTYKHFDEFDKWLEMATENAKIILYQRQDKQNLDQTNRLDELKLVLNQDVSKIDCFDISHLLGNQTVASCVVFEHGFMQKAYYRHYNLSDQQLNGDDLKAMSIAIERHYSKHRLPDLLLIDGGVLQLNAVHQMFEKLSLSKENLLILAITKGENRRNGLETLTYFNAVHQPIQLDLAGDSPSHLLLQHIRDEAHRFAITYHRTLRSKNQLVSKLDDLQQVGKIRKQRLLARFGSFEAIKQLSIEELSQVEGFSQKLAEFIWNQIHSK